MSAPAVVVVADGNDRYTLSTLTAHFDNFTRFLVYAVGVTAHEMMVDSLLHRLVGSGL